MKTPKHTPKWWIVDGDTINTYHENEEGDQPASEICNFHNTRADGGELEANKALIAAAPEMRELLAEIIETKTTAALYESLTKIKPLLVKIDGE